jgi:hypothetical protein
MRRDLVVMGGLAAIAGIALAAMLTASFGARSSGPPALLKPAAEALPAKAADPPKAAVSRKPRPHSRPRHRQAQHAPVLPAQGTTSLADAQQPPTIKPAVQQPRPATQPKQQVTTPAPAPQPVRPLSRPARPKKGGSGSGATFDDSG